MLKNYITYLSMTCILLFISNNCYTSEKNPIFPNNEQENNQNINNNYSEKALVPFDNSKKINRNIDNNSSKKALVSCDNNKEILQDKIDDTNKNQRFHCNLDEDINKTFVTVDGNPAPQLSTIQVNQEYNDDITLLKKENNELTSKIELLLHNFGQMKRDYDIAVTSKIYRNELKKLYKNRINLPDTSFFQKQLYSDTENNSYTFTWRITNILNCIKPNFPLKKQNNSYGGINYINPNNKEFDNIITLLQRKSEIENQYEQSDNICNWILDQQTIFFNSINNRIKEMEKFEKYLNLLLDQLPDWDPKNTQIREEIKLLINDNYKPIMNELTEYKSLQNSLNLNENLSNIDYYIGKIKEEIEKIKTKITGKPCINNKCIIDNNKEQEFFKKGKNVGNKPKFNKKNESKIISKEKVVENEYTIRNKILFNDLKILQSEYDCLLNNHQFFVD